MRELVLFGHSQNYSVLACIWAVDVFWIGGAHLQIVAVPWRKSEDGAKMGGDGVKGDVVMMEMEKHDLAPKSANITREDLEEFWFAAKCPWRVSLLTGTARQAYIGNCRRRIEEELRGTVKAEAAQRCVKEYHDTAVERRTKRTKSSPEEGQTAAPINNEFAARRHQHQVQAAAATQREPAPSKKAMDPVGWTRGRKMLKRKTVEEEEETSRGKL